MIAGVFAAVGKLNLFWLLVPVTLCAILGDQLGYWIGRKAGQSLYDRDESRFFQEEPPAPGARFLRKARREDDYPGAICPHRPYFLSPGHRRRADELQPLFVL